jgi:hypothetical protein
VPERGLSTNFGGSLLATPAAFAFDTFFALTFDGDSDDDGETLF